MKNKTNKILIFGNCLEGHHLEYIHHLYMRATKEVLSDFIFVIPDEFLKMRNLLEWPDASNINFDFLDANETYKCNNNKYLHYLGSQTYSARLLCKKIKKHQPDHVFMLSIDMGIPFLDLFLGYSKSPLISCIIYRIVPYQWHSLSAIKKITEWITYHITLRKKRYKTCFLLNSHKYISVYNKKFRTDKYKYLDDPVTTDIKKGDNLRATLEIPDAARVYVHLGVMGRDKGTLRILEALNLFSEDDARDRYFIFAGKITDGIRDEFYEKYKSLPPYCHVILYDKFCEYDLFCSLYKTCDYVLFPYTPRPNSSGLLGNAALFGKPVITTDGGAMGDLVREYHLGHLMPDNSVSSIYQAILKPDTSDFSPKKYSESHTIENFCEQIFSSFR